MTSVPVNALPPLRELQRWFAAVVRHPRGVAAGVRDAAPRVAMSSVARGAAARQFAPRSRLDVYAYAYGARLVEVLASDYAAVRDRIGERTFDRVARAYLVVHPSRGAVLNQLGARFPAFLGRARVVVPAVVELARFELALTRAFDAPEFVPMAADALLASSPSAWERAVFAVNPSVQVVRIAAAVADWFTAWRLGSSAPPVRPGSVDMLIARVGEQLIRRESPRPATVLLSRLRRGEPLGKALRGLRAGTPLDAWFAQWRADGVFTAIG